MRSFTPKIIAAAAIFAAIPLSSAYAVHRHKVDTTATASVPADPETRAVYDQLQGVKQGIVEAMDAKAITPEQEHDLMMQADSIHRSATGDGTYRALLSKIEKLDQQLQDDSGGGTYMGDGSDGGYYPNG